MQGKSHSQCFAIIFQGAAKFCNVCLFYISLWFLGIQKVVSYRLPVHSNSGKGYLICRRKVSNQNSLIVLGVSRGGLKRNLY